jgi:hypothetical protein
MSRTPCAAAGINGFRDAVGHERNRLTRLSEFLAVSKHAEPDIVGSANGNEFFAILVRSPGRLLGR